jgi:beta-glucosidase
MFPMSVRSAVTGALALGLLACATHTPEHPPAENGRVAHLLSQMTLEEKISLLHGAPDEPSRDLGEAGYLPGIPRLGIPPLRFADGPPGVLTREPATAFTATMGLAATFSEDDARANGVAIARDARSQGIDVALQPFINIHRDQTFARSFNTYGEDPLLTGTIGAALIRGIQGEGVLAQAKHFIGYDGASDVTVDPQTLHEIYLAPFVMAIDAGVASMMCSYNVINGAYSCGNRELLTGVLRGELKFEGFVTSDWGAVHATPFVDAGDDLEMPGFGWVMDSYFAAQVPAPGTVRPPLLGPVVNPMPEEGHAPPGPPFIQTVPMGRPLGMVAALQSHQVSEASIDRAAGNILRQMDRFGLLDRRAGAAPGAGDEAAARRVLDNAATVLKTSEDAAVLLKNNGGLPLPYGDGVDSMARNPTQPGSLALIGPGALQLIATGESGEKALGYPERQMSPAAALRRMAGATTRVSEAVADDMTGEPVPASNFGCRNQIGLTRTAADGSVLAHDAQLNFTQSNGQSLPAGSSVSWSGCLQIPVAGTYRLYVQVLGASAVLEVDGKREGATGPLQLHGDYLQGPQDNVLPTTDGLDNVRREFEFTAGEHAVTVRVKSEQAGKPVQVRLAWVTPSQRAATYRRAVDVAAHADRAVVFAWSRNRPDFHLPGDQDQLISDIAAANPNTTVVLNISEPIAMPWLDKVRAVVLMWYPGDEGGQATADVLLGRVSPAGRLPFTWPRALEDGVANDPAHPERSSVGVNGRTTYSEGIFVGYRWFDQQHLEPLYPFGFGLSYTRFEYSGLAVRHAQDGGLDVELQLRNTGAMAGDEVAQLYLGPPAQAPAQPTAQPSGTLPANVQFASRALAAFKRVHLQPGERRHVRLHVTPRALSYWSADRGQWLRTTGPRAVWVGASERDLRLTGQTP